MRSTIASPTSRTSSSCCVDAWAAGANLRLLSVRTPPGGAPSDELHRDAPGSYGSRWSQARAAREAHAQADRATAVVRLSGRHEHPDVAGARALGCRSARRCRSREAAAAGLRAGRPVAIAGSIGASHLDRRGAGDRLDQPERGGQVVRVEQARRRAADPADAWSSNRRAQLDHRSGPSARSASYGRRAARPPTLSRVQRRHVAAARVVQVRPAAGHPGPEVGADRPEHDDRAAGHVLAAVRADPLDDRLGAAVADREAHPRPADEVQPPAGRAVEDGVAGDGLAGGVGRQVGLGDDRDPAAGQALADVVVGLADELAVDAGPDERAERLAGGAAQLEADRAAQLAALERAGQSGAERAVGRGQAQAAGRRPALAAERGGDPRPPAATPARGDRRAPAAAGFARRAAVGAPTAPRR